MTRESNRQAMPTVAQIVDEYRSMGYEVRVIWAAERGKTLGTPTSDENAYTLDESRFRQTTVNRATK